MGIRYIFAGAALVVGLAVSIGVRAGEFNQVLSVGDAAPAWTKLPGSDGSVHSLSDLATKPVVVLVFTCASCPTAVDYEERINALAKRYEDKKSDVAVVAICVNRVTEDQLPALTAHAKEKQLRFTYLYDESQKIARDYGALSTPEFYVLNRDRKIVYMGAMDDATDVTKVTKRYVEDGIAAALAGKIPETKETVSRGCLVRYVNERRKRAKEANPAATR